MTTAEVLDKLKSSELEEITLTITGMELAAIGFLLHTAVNAGCQVEAVKTARCKVLDVQKGRLSDEWPSTL